MKFLMVDDDLEFLNLLTIKLKEEFNDIEIDSQKQFNDDYSYDVYFLDIDMSEDNGIEIAKRIKKADENKIVIFVTFCENMVFDALKSFPYYFLRKRYFDDELRILIQKLKRKIINSKIEIEYKNEVFFINVNDINYIKKDGNYVYVVCKQKIYKVKQPMKYFIKELPLSIFGIVYQGFIVHFDYVKEENDRYIVIKNNVKVYFSRGKRKDFFRNYIMYINIR